MRAIGPGRLVPHGFIAGAVLGLAVCVGAAAQDHPAGAVRITPSEMQWRVSPATGLEYVYLLGNPTQSGPYVYRVRWPPNFTLGPHTHPDDRSLLVISGTHYHAFGDRYDARKLEPGPAGTFFTEPAKVPHFGATRGEAVILQISGTGPSRTDFIDPADDPSKK